MERQFVLCSDVTLRGPWAEAPSPWRFDFVSNVNRRELWIASKSAEYEPAAWGDLRGDASEPIDRRCRCEPFGSPLCHRSAK